MEGAIPKFKEELDLPPAPPGSEDQEAWDKYNRDREEWEKRQKEKEASEVN